MVSRRQQRPKSVHSPDYSNVVGSGDVKGLVYNLESEGIFRATPGKATVGMASDDPLTKERIMNARIYCIHKDSGCSWSGALAALKGHLNVCKLDAVPCLNHCGSRIARLSMEDHMLTTCANRLVRCQFCDKEFTGSLVDDHARACAAEPVHCELKCGSRVARGRLRAHQEATCPKRMVPCTLCSAEFTADTVKAHQESNCPSRTTGSRSSLIWALAKLTCWFYLDLVPVGSSSSRSSGGPLEPCQFRDAGCKFSAGSKAEMDDHLRSDIQIHLDQMCRLVHKLNGQLERAHTSFNGVLMWKINDFYKKLEESK